ncbi:MAG: GSU2403 family nucleotidyltransferase fold protein [Aquidulcibacter sp.]|jgi:hypothetical protein|uniref:nucleotidyltransferase family protein n=1 Tax=Aquidulcibacter sp. TaxID=2052990 RepID=UPI0022C8C8AA|nr:GSU2403 family nucleotidyltransferase fold protein [Aquidulcibacter sp.]MCZ8208945.1 GSU2403 family nucleotidyltransferase fold protein [Aquidulcibacter sp.]
MTAIATFPIALQTLYAELLDQLRLAEVGDLPAGTSFRKQTLSNREYWYAQPPTTPTGRPKEIYLGPDSPKLADLIAQTKTAGVARKARRSIVRSLLSAGYFAPDALTGDLVDALAKAGLFRLRGVLIGTSAFQAYGPLLGVRLPGSAVRTADLDLAQDYGVSLALGDTIDPLLLEALQSVDPSFRAIPDTFNPALPLAYVNADQFRVDVLTTNRGAPSRGGSALPSLGTGAVALRFLDFLLRDPIEAALLHRSGALVSVPSPARYAVHKLIVAIDRKGPGAIKAAKDITQAEVLIQALTQARRQHELLEVWEEALDRGEGWRTRLQQGHARLNDQARALLPM